MNQIENKVLNLVEKTLKEKYGLTKGNAIFCTIYPTIGFKLLREQIKIKWGKRKMEKQYCNECKNKKCEFVGQDISFEYCP